MERGKGARAPDLDGVQLRRRAAVVCLFRGGLRPEGCSSVRAREAFPVPPLLRPHLRPELLLVTLFDVAVSLPNLLLCQLFDTSSNSEGSLRATSTFRDSTYTHHGYQMT